MSCSFCRAVYQLAENTALILDLALNTVLGGNPHETLSARTARARAAGSRAAAMFCVVLSWIGRRFHGQGDHCAWALAPGPSIGAEVWHWSPPAGDASVGRGGAASGVAGLLGLLVAATLVGLPVPARAQLQQWNGTSFVRVPTLGLSQDDLNAAKTYSIQQGAALAMSQLPSTTFLAQGGVVPRTLASHQILQLPDLAVLATGTNPDQSPTFQTAQNVMQGAGGGTIRVPPGAYTLRSNVYTAGGNTWLFERGATLAGTGQLDAVADSAVLNSSGIALARLLSATSNEHGIFVSLRAAPTNGTAGTEKTAFIASIIQGDPSSYTGAGVLKDLVGFESQGVIATGNMTGRIFGYSAGVGPQAGADGYAVGGEFSVQSYSGSDAGPFGSPTSKIAVHAVAQGNSNSTAAYAMSGNGAQFLDGFVADTAAIVPGGHAFSVRPFSAPTAPKTRADDIAYIGIDGSAAFTRLVVGLYTPPSSSAPCTAGQTSDDTSYHYVCVAANTWKRVALSSF